jgi:hypothetical protein
MKGEQKMTIKIGSYIIEENDYSIFNPSWGKMLIYRKNGRVIARSDEEGLKFESGLPLKIPVIMTRSQGYRYWEKHFPNRICYSLPALIEAAVDLYDDSEVVYQIDKNSEPCKALR